MYYLAFFLDYQPFFKNKIKSWLSSKKKYTCYITNKTNNHNVVPIQKLLECEEENLPYYFNEPWYRRYDEIWCVHGDKSKNIDHTLQFSDLLIKKHNSFSISLEEIDFLLHWFANQYKWSILPWYDKIRFRSFVFISNDRILRDKFIECSSNNIKIPFLANSKKNLLINQYEVDDYFSKVMKGIIFTENIDTIGEIWEACKCDIQIPWLLTNIDFSKYRFLNKFLDKNITHIKTFKRNKYWQVYIPYDKISFLLICQELILHSQNLDGRSFWAAKTTNLDDLSRILIKIESHEINYSDLSYLKDFLIVCEWLYGLGIDITIPDNDNCSLFITRDNNILQEINIFRQEETNSRFTNHFYYDLLTCF